MISNNVEASNNANNIETFSVSNLSDNKSFPGSFLRKSKTVSASLANGYFGWGGLLLSIPGMRADTLDLLPTQIFPTGHETPISQTYDFQCFCIRTPSQIILPKKSSM